MQYDPWNLGTAYNHHQIRGSEDFGKNPITIHRIAISPEASPFARFFDQFSNDFVQAEFHVGSSVFRVPIAS
jgi:hypothetical protein